MCKLYFIFLLLLSGAQVNAQTININGPAGSGLFGKSVTVLSNGNFVVTDPSYDEGGIVNVGAVYLYDGSNHALISTLKGITSGDSVGSGGVIDLNNSNFLVSSPAWDNNTLINAGAVTWVNGITGITNIVSISNSLVGSTANDRVGADGVTALSSGNYVVCSSLWDNGTVINAGAVTWGNGTIGLSGNINNSNSLIGSTADDFIGRGPIFKLSNGNYLVNSPDWDNGGVTDAGAITWGNGTTGISGIINNGNSLVGSIANDKVGNDGITELANGNYVVSSDWWDNGGIINAGAITFGNGTTGSAGTVNSGNSLIGSSEGDLWQNKITPLNNGNYLVSNPYWDNGGITDAGAVTWGNGTTGVTGMISSSNSLVGSTSGDNIGNVIALTNDNYVVSSSQWDNGGIPNAGAVTWGNGTTGITGIVNSSNSLVGSTANDNVGNKRIAALTNGNYVVSSSEWDNAGILNAGAVTWGNGTTGITGMISSSNSLVGSKAQDEIGYGDVTALTNGNYVVSSPYWANGAVSKAGAVTWGNGTTGVTGMISSSNSLVGSKSSDNVGNVTTLTNGNYVVHSSQWDNGSQTNAGAVTWGDGATGVTGLISSSNSFVGTHLNDELGLRGIVPLSNGNYVFNSMIWNPFPLAYSQYYTWGNGTLGTSGTVNISNSLIAGPYPTEWYKGPGEVTALNNGNYVISFPDWDNGSASNAGSITRGNGSTGTTGTISSSNSLVGSKTNDRVGYQGITILNNDMYFSQSAYWDNGSVIDAGAITFFNGAVTGLITGQNSVMGTSASGGTLLNADYNSTHEYLIVGRPADNIVTIFNPTIVPLQWLSFSANISQNDVLVKWKTTNEINTKNFEVERSTDGTNFITVDTVTAINTAGDHSYNYTDAGAALLNTTKLFYRLKQVDHDGRYMNSQIVLLHLTRSSNITLYPNPASNTVVLSISDNALLNSLVSIISMGGQEVMQFRIKDYQEQINISRLKAGLYVLKISDGTSLKFIKY